MRRLWILYSLVFVLPSALSDYRRRKPDFVLLEAEKERDSVGYEALKFLHKQMDDDSSGSVTLEESSDFVMEELNVKEKERVSRRQQNFHTDNDATITVDELWERWVLSKERNWTVEETVNWLTKVVELPQYVETFQRNAVDGLTLPRFAAIQNASYLVNVLGIANPVHRQKIHLKAMDVVLFGSRQGSGYLKDLALMLLLGVAIMLYAMFRFQKTKTQKELNQLTVQMEKLKGLEKNFDSMQGLLNEERKKQDELSDMASAQESEKSEQIENLKIQLEAAERQLEEGSQGYAPLALQPLLRRTCEMEMVVIGKSKREHLREMREAMQLVEKLRKKQTGVMSSMKLAVRSDSDTENLDQKILEIKQKMEALAERMEECQRRWTQTESLCGFPILGAGPLRPAALSAANGRGQRLATPVIHEAEDSQSDRMAVSGAYSPARVYEDLLVPAPSVVVPLMKRSSFTANHASLNSISPSDAFLSRHTGGSHSALSGPIRSSGNFDFVSRTDSHVSSSRLSSPSDQPRFHLGDIRKYSVPCLRDPSTSKSSSASGERIGEAAVGPRLRKEPSPPLAEAGKHNSQDSSGSSGGTQRSPESTNKKKSFLGFPTKKKI